MARITLADIDKETQDMVIEFLKEHQKDHNPLITTWGVVDGSAFIEFRVKPIRIKINELTKEGLSETMLKGFSTIFFGCSSNVPEMSTFVHDEEETNH